jgi:OFA family oxalate/formate antiporter-like MFS transporter
VTAVHSRTLICMLPAIAANLCAGSIYSISVVLRALEDEGTVPRASGAGGFSLATVAFLAGVLTHPPVARRAKLSRHTLVAAIAGAAAVGIAAANRGDPVLLALSAALYGAGCGHLYCCALGAVRSSGVNRPGLATGMVVAAFALGSVVWSLLLSRATESLGLGVALWLLSAAFALVGGAASWLLSRAGEQHVHHERIRKQAYQTIGWSRQFLLLWLGFFSVSAAGLGVISQSAVFSKSAHTLGPAALTALVGVGNGLGRLAGGALVDILAARFVTSLIALIAGLSLAVGSAMEGWGFALAMCAVTLSYGAASGAYPAMVMKLSTRDSFAGLFARLFTSWGAAAIVAPSVVVAIWESQGSYAPAFIIIASFNIGIGLLFLFLR